MSTSVTPIATSEQTKTLSRLSGFVQQIDSRLSELTEIDAAAMLKLSVQDEATALQAKQDRADAKAYITSVEEILAEPTSIAHQLHKSFTTLRGTLTKDALAVIAHHDAEVAAYSKREREKREAIERELQRAAEKAAREEHARELARLEAERKAKEESALPWELDVAVEAPAPPPLVLPKVEIPRAPVAAGFGIRNLPWTYEVKDIMELIRAIADGRCKFNPENPCVQINPQFFTAAARFHKDKLGIEYPGVEGIRPQKDKY